MTAASVASLIACRNGLADAGDVMIGEDIIADRKLDKPPVVAVSLSSSGLAAWAVAALADLH